MKQLVCCIGLPGSGKSTWAKEQEPEYVRINKDNIRERLTATVPGWQWSPANEKDVTQERDRLISYYLAAGCSVISDDTNMASKHRVRLAQLAKKHGAEFVVKRFDTPIEECITRDAARANPVGERVIRDMAATYHCHDPIGKIPQYSQFAKYEPRSDLPCAIICDLDGTLALNKGHRSFYDASTCDQDEINLPIRTLLGLIDYDGGIDTIFVSGREDKYRPQTTAFLNRCGVSGDLFMRKTGDMRKDWIIKGEIFDEHIRNNYNVLFVLDDRDQVVKFWRYLGLTCLQVNEGAF